MSQNPSFQARRWVPRWWRRAQVYLRRVNIFPWLLGVAIASLLAAWLSAYIVLSDQSDKGHLLPSVLTTTLLIGMLVPAMAILMLIGRILALRRAAASIGSKGKLHVQLVFLFSMIAAVPTLLVVIFASILFQQGVEFWFSDNSRGMLENANKLAQGYYEQSQRDVSDNAVAMAYDVRDALSRVSMVSREFTEGFSYQVLQRKLDEVAILQKAPDGHLNTAVFVDPTGKPRDWVTRQSCAVLMRANASSSTPIPTGSRRLRQSTAMPAFISSPRAVRTFSRSARASARKTSCEPIRC